MGSFNWAVAEQCAAEGFEIDVVSTDIWNGTCYGPCYDLPTVMTKCMYLGMSLEEVVTKATLAPAEAIGWSDRIGTLGLGRCADIAVLRLDEVRKTPSWPRSWANFSLFQLYSHRNAWANLHIWEQPNTFLAEAIFMHPA